MKFWLHKLATVYFYELPETNIQSHAALNIELLSCKSQKNNS